MYYVEFHCLKGSVEKEERKEENARDFSRGMDVELRVG